MIKRDSNALSNIIGRDCFAPAFPLPHFRETIKNYKVVNRTCRFISYIFVRSIENSFAGLVKRQGQGGSAFDWRSLSFPLCCMYLDCSGFAFSPKGHRKALRQDKIHRGKENPSYLHNIINVTKREKHKVGLSCVLHEERTFFFFNCVIFLK